MKQAVNFGIGILQLLCLLYRFLLEEQCLHFKTIMISISDLKLCKVLYIYFMWNCLKGTEDNEGGLVRTNHLLKSYRQLQNGFWTSFSEKSNTYLKVLFNRCVFSLGFIRKLTFDSVFAIYLYHFYIKGIIWYAWIQDLMGGGDEAWLEMPSQCGTLGNDAGSRNTC